MKIRIKCVFDTGGLKYYRIRKRRLFGLYVEGDYLYHAVREFNKNDRVVNDSKVVNDAVNYLTDLACHIEGCSNHYKVLGDMYIMFDSIVHWLEQVGENGVDSNCGILTHLPDSYSGTFIRVDVVKEECDED